jgi:hypothetical protein
MMKLKPEEERPLVYRIGHEEIQLWPEERAMLRDFATLGSYPTAYTQAMQDLKAAGVFSRLEECGPNGTAVITDFGRELFKRIGADLAVVQ